ncbi:MAG TPA: hypothetical protein VFC19_08015 [Candidatus Limnocylindrales bacterium]|nr:hypothetical protein [Candidatus Limnocylindrales bacterium]
MTQQPAALVPLPTVATAPAGSAGVGSLSWAQQFMIEVMLASQATVGDFDLLYLHDLEPALSVDAASDLIRRLVVAHPVLRVAIHETADGQTVHDSVPLPIASVRIEDVSGRLRPLVPSTSFGRSFSALFVIDGDSVVRIAVRFNHMVIDSEGAQILMDSLAALALGEPTEAHQPLTDSPTDLARFEESELGQRIQRRSLDHAIAAYESAPPTMWQGRRPAEAERFWFGDLRSTGLLHALTRLVDEASLSRVGVLAASIATVVAARAGTPSALMYLISGNRFDLKWTGYPGQLAQEAVLHLPIGDTVLDTMRTTTKLAMRALLNARYSPAKLYEVRDLIERRRGVSFDKLGNAVVLNLLGPAVAVPDIRPMPSTFSWHGYTNQENLGLYIDAFQDDFAFVLRARVDTALLAPDEAEAVLRRVESTIVAAASDSAVLREASC